MKIQNIISLASSFFLTTGLILFPLLPGSFAQPPPDVSSINELFTPDQNLFAIHDALVNELPDGSFIATTNARLVGRNPPTGVRIVFERAVAGEPTVGTIRTALERILAAQDGPQAVFDTHGFEINVDADPDDNNDNPNDGDEDDSVEVIIQFTWHYQLLQTTPNDREEPSFEPPAPPGPFDEVTCISGNMMLPRNVFDFSFNSPLR